jgi:peptidoglycan/LPS O-acetylase OafA/YrhL
LWLLARRAVAREDPFRALPALVAAITVACVALRLWTSHRIGYTFWSVSAPTHLRADALAAGVLLAYGSVFQPERIESLRPWRWPLLLAGIACFVPSVLWEREQLYVHTVGLFVQDLGGAAIVLWAWFAPEDRAPLPVRALAAIGIASYSIYLWHEPYAQRIALRASAGNIGWLAMMLIYVAAAFAIGTAAYYLVERPALRLRGALFPSR